MIPNQKWKKERNVQSIALQSFTFTEFFFRCFDVYPLITKSGKEPLPRDLPCGLWFGVEANLDEGCEFLGGLVQLTTKESKGSACPFAGAAQPPARPPGRPPSLRTIRPHVPSGPSGPPSLRTFRPGLPSGLSGLSGFPASGPWGKNSTILSILNRLCLSSKVHIPALLDANPIQRNVWDTFHFSEDTRAKTLGINPRGGCTCLVSGLPLLSLKSDPAPHHGVILFQRKVVIVMHSHFFFFSLSGHERHCLSLHKFVASLVFV